MAATTEDAVLWLAYPKLTSQAYTSDLSRDILWPAVAPLGIKPIRQIAIDEDWTALRFKRM